jgi:hypothetical protein
VQMLREGHVVDGWPLEEGVQAPSRPAPRRGRAVPPPAKQVAGPPSGSSRFSIS